MSISARQVFAVLCLPLLCMVAALSASGSAHGKRAGVVAGIVRADLAVEGVVDGSPGSSRSGLIPVHVTRVIHGTLPDSDLVLRTIAMDLRAGTKVLATAIWRGARGNEMTGYVNEVLPNGSMFNDDAFVDGKGADSLDGQPISDPGSYGRVLAGIDGERKYIASHWLLSGTSVILVRVTSVDKHAGTLGIETIRTVLGAAVEHTPTVIRRPRTRVHGCGFVAVFGARLLLPSTPMSPDTLDAVACLERLVIDDQGDIPVFGLPLDSIGTVVSVTDSGLNLQPIVPRSPRR